MYQDIFKQIGFNKNEAIVYDFLLQHGAVSAGEIIKKTPLKRGVVYNVLNDLIKKGLIAEKKKNKKTIFNPLHPEKLRDYVLAKEKAIQSAKNALESNLPDIVSGFNLVSGQPGVRYFEGKNEIKKALKIISDNFTEKTEILSFVKVLPKEFVKDVNTAFTAFIKKRIQTKVFTRVIAIKSRESLKLQKDDKKSLRKTMLVDLQKMKFDFAGGEFFIYKNMICAVILNKNRYSAFLVEDKNISQFLKMFFEAQWLLINRSSLS